MTGDGVERLTATAAEAAERGPGIWLQPTVGDVPERDVREHLAETGRFAERLRRHGAAVDFSVGCEFWLFVPGIVPGDTVLERIRSLLDGRVDPVAIQRPGRLAALRHRGHRLLRVLPRQGDCARESSRHLRWGKPLAITEFGTCAHVGAPEAGGMGWDVVDHDKEPAEIKGDPVRSERTQAVHLGQLLDVYSSTGLYAAMAFEFVNPDAPHRPDAPQYDLDMAGYAITRTLKDRPDAPAPGWHWREPKEAFHALARRYRAGRRAGGHGWPAGRGREAGRGQGAGRVCVGASGRLFGGPFGSPRGRGRSGAT
ncbi:abortive phage infection protein [Streptomyces tricolor]|uniref:Abortive phage infection protein n=1 Tax=Streptomyces tricolor TaxID=68277 RepID=A0ABS9JIP9_9ACTN|nr:abortive phage infection protein [Streptomyces tricolor]MCG0065354.1 abortive phage infection protein [Streptomyces tricolor]